VSSRHSEAGSATVLASFLLSAVVVAAIVAGWWAGAVSVRHQAGTAADLAAVAGAQALVSGLAPCASADRLARANGAEVVSCRVEGSDVRVVARASAQVRVLGRVWELTARGDALAGPVASPSG
jgi:secretion/DNA translocation related TadE-like protein